MGKKSGLADTLLDCSVVVRASKSRVVGVNVERHNVQRGYILLWVSFRRRRRRGGRCGKDQYESPADFRRLLSAKLRKMTESGKLFKVKRKYRIAPTAAISEGRSSKVLLIEGRQSEPYRVVRDDIKQINKSQVDAYLSRMRSMTQQEAAAAAAQAVAAAEIATADAEEAMRQAEAAEADAEAAKAFAEAASLTLKNRNAAKMWAGITA